MTVTPTVTGPAPFPFHRIGLFAKHNAQTVSKTFEKVIDFLSKNHELTIEAQSATLLPDRKFKTVLRENLADNQDLIIVIGGDGSILNASRSIAKTGVPILGINRGRLGFLADINPNHFERELTKILQGNYFQEERMLLQVHVYRNHKPSSSSISDSISDSIADGIALNDIVLYTGGLARMIEFEVYIGEHLVLRQRADGLITATPTGSTAYALSGGGPILHPNLKAITLVPMFPHTLSSRPIVVDDNSQIDLIITQNNDIEPKLSCDGQVHFDLKPGDTVSITKYPHSLKLIHPTEYDYYAILRKKLGWSTLPIKD